MAAGSALSATAKARGWKFAIAVVLVAAAAFAAGRFSTFAEFASSDLAAPSPNSADVGFARDMQVHHAQAVEMAMIEYRATDDDELRTLAYDISTAQAGQRGEMYGWLVNWDLPQAGGTPMAWMTSAGHEHGADPERGMGMASPSDLAALAGAKGKAQDCLFVSLMLTHHRGAIAMTEAVATLGSDPRVLATAAQMSQSQSSEIAALQSVQSRLGCTSS